MADFTSLRPTPRAARLSEIADIVGGSLSSAEAFADPLIEGVSIATDDLDPGWLFVAVPGQRHHGAAFAQAAAAKGAVAVLTDAAGAELSKAAGLPTVVVAQPRQVAGLVARYLYPEHADLRLAGVTGTNGKTTTCHLLRSVLQQTVGVTAVFGTIGADLGTRPIEADRTTQEAPAVYRALTQARTEGAQAAVLEVSSHALELGRVEGLFFDVAVFTNLQSDHLDFHGDMETYLEAKAKLFQAGRSKQGVVAVDDEWGRQLVQDAQIPVQAVQALGGSPVELGVPTWRVTNVEPHPQSGGSTFLLEAPDGQVVRCLSPMPGPANVQDAALALVAAVALQVPLEQAVEALSLAPTVPGRIHWVSKPTSEAPGVLVDFAHTPEAVEALIETMRPFTPGRLIAVFGTDGDRDASKRIPLARVFARDADVLFVTDENPRTEDAASIRDQLLEGVRLERPDLAATKEVKTGRRDAIFEAITSAQAGDLVLITGKGIEPYQEWGNQMIPFDEPAIAAEEFSRAGYEIQVESDVEDD